MIELKGMTWDHSRGYDPMIATSEEFKKKNDNNNGLWLVQGQESLADWAIWPFIRQYRLVDPQCFDQDEEIQELRQWLGLFLNSHIYKKLMTKCINLVKQSIN